MQRRCFLLAPVAALVAFLGRRAAAQNPSTFQPGQGGRTEPTLQETLEKGLKARRPEDFAFIALVVGLVEEGVLSERLVRRTFLWARRKSRREMQYFERALVILAARQGIKL